MLGINIIEHVKCQYTENYKTFLINIKDLNKWRNMLCSRVGRLDIVKISIVLQLIYRLSAVLIKILVGNLQKSYKVCFQITIELNQESTTERHQERPKIFRN